MIDSTKIQSVRISQLNELVQAPSTTTIIDSTILEKYPETVRGAAANLIILTPHERHKTIDGFVRLSTELAKRNVNKNTHLLAIGGGGLTDLVGFTAAVYMRGIGLSFVPTTLLAMVDAAVGGKNALDVGNIKNLLGTVYLPQNIYVSIEFTGSLLKEQFMAGFAEIFKIALLFDKNLLQDSVTLLSEVILPESDIEVVNLLNSIVLRSIEHKLVVVQADLMSTGQRHLLNFGHTAGHALELTHNLTHGYAVACGMLIETLIAAELRLTSAAVAAEVRHIVSTYYNPSWPELNLAAAANYIHFDKKIAAGSLLFPVITEIGRSQLFDINLVDFVNCLKNLHL